MSERAICGRCGPRNEHPLAQATGVSVFPMAGPFILFCVFPFLLFLWPGTGSTFPNFHSLFLRIGRCPVAMLTTQERAMRRILIVAIMFLGVTTAQGQTVSQLNGQSNGTAGAVGSDPLGVPTSPLSSLPSPSGSQATTGSASGAAGATNTASVSSQSPLLLPGEIKGTSTQAASTTATAPGAPSPICPPPVPSTDGGSANLSEMAGASLSGC